MQLVDKENLLIENSKTCQTEIAIPSMRSLDLTSITVTKYMTKLITHHLSKTRTATVQCLSRNNWSYQGHFKGKTIWRTSCGVPSATPLVQKTILLLQLFNNKHPHYLFKLIPSRSSSYVTRNIRNIPFFKTRHTFLKALSSRQLLMNGINLSIT